MVQTLTFLFCLLLFAFLGCEQLSVQYEWIEHDKVRLLDFVYEPVEAGPGDTVELRALFAGEPVSSDMITWSMSSSIFKNIYGVDTALNEVELQIVGAAEQCTFTDSTSCISMRFIIPDYCLMKSPMIPENWISMIPNEDIRKKIPSDIRGYSARQLIGMFSLVDSQTISKISDLVPYLPIALEYLSSSIRIYADVQDAHRIYSDYAVNFNRKFASLPGTNIFENHNPIIDSVSIYKVKGASRQIFKDKDVEEIIRLPGPEEDAVTLTIQKDYTYFVRVYDRGKDNAYALDTISGKWEKVIEDQKAEWFIKMRPEEREGLVPNDLMYIMPLDDQLGILYTPRKDKVKNFTLWVQVTDYYKGIFNRSQGSTVAEFHGKFTYSEDYLKQYEGD